MTQRIRPWLATALVFTLVNAVGGGYALAGGEMFHANTHFVLMLAGTYAAWRLATRALRVAVPASPPTPLAADRLEQLQQSVDVVAIELERLGEAQRFNARQEAERVEQRR